MVSGAVDSPPVPTLGVEKQTPLVPLSCFREVVPSTKPFQGPLSSALCSFQGGCNLQPLYWV